MRTSGKFEGERGGRGGRIDPSTTNKDRDKQRDEWRYRPRRSVSPPPMRVRPREMPASPSVERRSDYGFVSSRIDHHGKQQLRQRHEHPLHLPTQSRGNHHAFIPFGDEYGRPTCDDVVQRKYFPSDSHFDRSRAIRSKELQHVASGGQSPPQHPMGRLDGKEVLVPKSIYLHDTSLRSFFTLPPDTAGCSSGAGDVVCGDINGIGGSGGGNSSRVEILRGEDLLYRDYVKDKYGNGEKRVIYSRDAPYTNEMTPLQQRTSGGILPSGLTKDNILHPYKDSICVSPQSFVRDSSISKLRADPLVSEGCIPYNSVRLDSFKGQALSSPVSDGSHDDYVYIDIARRDHGVGSVYKHVPRGGREGYREKPQHRFMDPLEGRVEESESSPRIMRNTNLWDRPSSPRRGPIRDYHSMKKVPEEYISGSVSLGFRTRPPHLGREFAHVERGHDYGSDDGLDVYRGGSRSPLLSEQFTEIYKDDVSPPRRRENMEDMDIYEPQADRVLFRKQYITNDEVDGSDTRVLYPATRSRPIEESVRGNEPWTSEERIRLASSKQSGSGRSQFKFLPRRALGSDAWFAQQGSDDGSDINNVKKRLRSGPSHFHGSISSSRRHDFYKPYKSWKKKFEDPHDVWNTNVGENIEDGLDVKSNHQEDSEEFKQHVHKAFLRFSKLLNEDSYQRKRYLEQGKAGSLLCCACGSLSKEFLDTHSLIMHAYNCLKFRLRADHLGLHKALCSLMGWNWIMTPDNGKLYQSTPTAEAKALKEDLILWPPLVVVHNISIWNKNMTGGPKIIDNEGMGEILRGIGFGAGKSRVFRGKPANQNVLLVKFLPTFTGLQEAEKLHKYYADNKRGRKEFEAVINPSTSSTCCPTEDRAEQLLFGYMGTVEDMDNLDQESKRRCVIKSKKDIEAIADAPLTSK